jgi:hypothetical protein
MILSASMYHGLVVSAGEPPLLSMSLLQLSFVLVPFLLFRLTEWPMILFCGLSVFIVLLNFNTLNNWLELKVSDNFLREGIYHYVTYTMAIAVSFSCVLGLVICT